jgi:DNA repair protein RadC
MYVPLYTTTLVRETSVRVKKGIGSSCAAKKVAEELLRDSPNEKFLVLCLDTKNNLIGASIVMEGTINACLVHPREVFRPAILCNACNVIVAHNHPSGDTAPSPEDWEAYRRLRDAGRIMGIGVLDSIIVGDTTISMGEV